MRYIIILISIVVVGCTNAKRAQENTGSQIDSLSFNYDSVKVYAKDSVSPDTNYTDTAKAVITYPVFIDEKLNQALEKRIGETIDENNKYTGYRNWAQSFIDGFEKEKASESGYRFMWFMLANLEVKSVTENLVSILHTYSFYQGGAHPNTVYLSYNIDPRTCSFLTIDSLLKPGGRGQLDVIAEHTFRQQEGLDMTQSLTDGYFFEEGRFALPQTFTLTDEGVLFTYSPYEIKSYAEGKTDLMIPFSQIRAIIKDEYLANRVFENR